MEDTFIEFLNSLGFPLGTLIAIIIGGVSLCSAIILGVRKLKKSYDERIEKKLLQEQEEREFRESMQNVANQVSSIQSDIATLSSKHDESISELNTKLEDVRASVIDGQRDSREGDIVLENQIRSYENAMDTLNVKLSNMDDKTTLLLESDKEGIKSFIIDKYYKAKEDKYIKLHVLQGLELRYEKYLQENGNTYVRKLMEEIRKMPNEPPDVTKE